MKKDQEDELMSVSHAYAFLTLSKNFRKQDTFRRLGIWRVRSCEEGLGADLV